MYYDKQTDRIYDNESAMEGIFKASNKSYKFTKSLSANGFILFSIPNGKNTSSYYVPAGNTVYSKLTIRGTVSPTFTQDVKRFKSIMAKIDEAVTKFISEIPSANEIEQSFTYDKGVALNRGATVSTDLTKVLKEYKIHLSQIERDYKELVTKSGSMERKEVNEVNNLKGISEDISNTMVAIFEKIIKAYEPYYNASMNRSLITKHIKQNEFAAGIALLHLRIPLNIIPKVFTTLVYGDDNFDKIKDNITG